MRFDIDTEQPVRGPDGFCIKCQPGEIGEAISKIINDPKRPSQRFEGYADPGATEKKVLRDAFEKGDRWFRTGDLMRKDADGYFYFVDRIGDTFRWKGENVATSEVSEAITAFPGIKEANVYGVRVPGAEGRVGMAALVVDDELDLDGFGRHVTQQLAAYARPVFLRSHARDRDDLDVQAAKARSGEAGLRSERDRRRDLSSFTRSCRHMSALLRRSMTISARARCGFE